MFYWLIGLGYYFSSTGRLLQGVKSSIYNAGIVLVQSLQRQKILLYIIVVFSLFICDVKVYIFFLFIWNFYALLL